MISVKRSSICWKIPSPLCYHSSKKKKKWNPLSLVHVHLTTLLKDIAHEPFVIGMLCLYIIHEDLLIFLYTCKIKGATVEQIQKGVMIICSFFSLSEKCPFSEFFWSVFCCIRFGLNTERWRSISLYSVRMRENADQKNVEYGHFSHSVYFN